MSRVPAPAAPRRPAPAPPEAADRGATRIADRVIAKIAAQAAREALRAADRPPPPEAAPPHATVVVHHDTARVRIVMETGYPVDLAGQAAAVRARVIRRVAECAELTVREVGVDVERLHPNAPGAARAAGAGRVR
ncbi:hypothetical protein ACN20G_21375 [Streptomyces sp. BI20]|uniref:hypothetical protein n=1 Tax=Streptomyces sp. BI20 TaxID=3403460 RepID=UPI003C71DB8A